MSNALISLSDWQPVVNLVIDGLGSPHSRDMYARSIRDFLAWWEKAGRPGLTKAVVQAYKVQALEPSGLSPASINLRLSAVRRLAREAADNGMITDITANGISRVEGVKMAGVRTGNWLTKRQAEELINAPDTSRLKGLRDRAILGVMIGGGLRRSEVAKLTFGHIQQREGRWAIVDIVGKYGRTRTVPIRGWTKVFIDEWAQAAGITTGLVFRGLLHGGLSLDERHPQMTSQAIYNAVASACIQAYKQTGDNTFKSVAAHDLRRTFAKLTHKGGAGVDQIQLSLGHASLKTTEKYLGVTQNLSDAPADHLGLDLK